MNLIHKWNCVAPYAPYGQKVKWRGLREVEIEGKPVLEKTYPAGAIGAKTKTSEADLTKVEFFINSLIPEEGASTFTLEWRFMVPQETIDTPTQGGGHVYDVMKIASLCSFDSATFKKADDSFAAIVMMGDPEVNPGTGLLEYKPILYPYIESWEYKVAADGNAYPIKQYAGKGIPGGKWVTLYLTVKLNTIATDAEGNTYGVNDGELLLWRKLDGEGSPELIYRRNGMKYADKDIEIERFEFVTFKGGGDLRYAPVRPTKVYFDYYALYEGQPEYQAATDQPGTDPEDVSTDGKKILALEAEIALLKTEIQGLYEINANLAATEAVYLSKMQEIAILADAIKSQCTQ